MKKILTLFAGYDKYNIIDEYVIYYIKELKKISDIIYASNCYFDDKELKKISDYCITTICTPHGEYDFGSYKRAYLYAKEQHLFEKYDYILICNDSCYGPFCDLNNIIDKMLKHDFSGVYMTTHKMMANNDNIALFFTTISKNIFLSDYFDNFMCSIKKENDKFDIIRKYEIGLSKLILDHNIELYSIYLGASNIETLYSDPLFLIKNGFPFLKKGTLEGKYEKVPISDFKSIMQIIKNNYDINLIVNHLNRVSNKEQINYLFYVGGTSNKNLISDKILSITNQYSVSGKHQTIYKIFNSIKITINHKEVIPNNFNFLLGK
ncbi:rhamnan synthesis F family protein [Brachyspira pilosicoli]|uniref:rhamnan synthesis F family protein n=1 Tax=Brachyspira pilosicoli TaxID=52584 RepID=UPI0030055284